MANVKITELTAYTNPASTDVVPIVDLVSDQTKKVTIADLLENAGAGSASAAAFAFDSDSDTGMYRPAANELGFTTGGTGRLFIDSSGQVGINTTSPDTLLDISSSDNAYVTVQSTANDKNALTFYKTGQAASSGFYVGLNASEEAMVWQTENNVIRFGTNNTERLRIDSSGRVGIKNSSMGSLYAGGDDLVVGDGSEIDQGITVFTGSTKQGIIAFADGFTGAAQQYAGYLLYSHNDDRMTFATSGQERMRIDSSGNVGIGRVPSGLFDIDVNGTALHVGFGANYDNYFTSGSSGVQIFRAGSTEHMRIDSSGRLLVGTTSSVIGYKTQIVDDNSTNLALFTGSSNAADNAPYLIINRSRGTTASPAVVNVGDVAGVVEFRGYSGAASAYKACANIKGVIDGTPDTASDTTDMPGRLAFFTSADGSSDPTERMRITSAGRVGINETTPDYLLHTKETTTADNYAFIENTTAGNAGVRIKNSSADYLLLASSSSLRFYNNGTSSESARIDSSGRLLVGLSTASGNYLLQAQGNAAASTNAGSMALRRGLAPASLTTNDTIGFIDFGPNDGGVGARVEALCDGTSATNDYPTRLAFSTTADGSSSPTERMRISSDGKVGIGTAASKRLHVRDDSDAYPLLVQNRTDGGSTCGIALIATQSDFSDGQYATIEALSGGVGSAAHGLLFRTCVSGGTPTERGRFESGGKFVVPGVYSQTTTGGSAVYVESDGDLLRYTSSLKYKTDVETIEDARADAILNCRPVWYRSKCANDVKTEGSEKSDWGWYGFIAEEVAEVEPRLVNWATKDAVTQEDGSVQSVERDPADYEAEGVRYDNFVPLLVNLVKRQQQAIETLEAKVAALEAG
jgi:hypothetical protein